MEKWNSSAREDIRHRHQHRRERESSNPSFSSTLLDAIYRSIDEGHGGHDGEEELVLYRKTMRAKQQQQYSNFCTTATKGNHNNSHTFEDDEASLCMIEKWMEKKVSEKVVVRRKSVADMERKSRSCHGDSLFLNSSSSSSDSSCGGVFSSSEIESGYGGGLPSRPKPIRTSISNPPEHFNKHVRGMNNSQTQNETVFAKPKHEGGGGGFVKTKSRALKIYGDLKKVKQPISPGGRLASFLNSLFTAGNAKKAKISSDDARRTTSKSAQASTCSSASSFSRSCLSKTPSSRGKLSNGTKRSVRFYPVSVIVDEDCQPCGHKSLAGATNLQKITRDDSINEELRCHLDEKNRRVEEAARDLLRNYQKKVECEFGLRNVIQNCDEFDNEDDDDDDDSCASSDLFELNNLSPMRIERYQEELPVYETTHFDTNRAIANGLIR